MKTNPVLYIFFSFKDAKTVVEKQQKNKFGETIIPPICQLSRDESHQNFAAALNSPAESLISDYQV